MAAIILLTFTACSKYVSECEEWEVEHMEFITGACFISLGCGGNDTRQMFICGEALKDAKPGNSIILRENQCCRYTRRFIRKL